MADDPREPHTRDPRWTRRRFLRTSAAGLGGVALLGGGGALALSQARRDDDSEPPPIVKPAEPLNLVVICLDTVRSDHVGAYARDGIRPDRAVRTPSIDQLAREGLRFSHFRSEVFPTGPSRRSVYTGNRTFPMDGWKPEDDSPHIYGWQRIPAGQETIDQVLRRNGYRTAMVTDNPWMLKPSWKRFRQGFDDFRAVWNQEHQRLRAGAKTERIDIADFVPRALLRRREEEKRVASYLKVVERYMRHTRTFEREDDWFSPRVFRQSMDWLDEHTRRRPTQPFALFVECYDPHEPWDPPKKYVDLYDDPDYRGVEPVQPFYGSDRYLSRRETQRMRALYAAELTMADRWMGNVLERLEEHRLMDRTVVVFWSDHGMSLAERGYVGKNPNQLYAEIVDSPLIIRHPERRKAGQTSDYLAQNHDIPATALAMLGFAAPRQNDGHDLSPLFRDEDVQEREVQTAGYNDYVFAADGRWSYIDSNRFKNPKLYDRRKDPREQRDVSSDHYDVVQRMRKAIREDAGNRTIPRY
jgi:arylsulfatase A-like enzyme